MFDLAGRKALVTGASSGLGRHFALTLARARAHVILAARREDLLEDVASQIRRAGGTCETMRLDVSRSDDVATAISEIGALDILVNNAGIAREGPFLDLSEPDWSDVLDTNLKGMFLVLQHAARLMRAGGRSGSVINIASILGLRQAAGVASYAVSKAAAIQLTRVAALELARFAIRVNALAPGYIATELNAGFWESDAGRAMITRIPQRRLGRVEDLEGPLLLLASDASAYMTGAVIDVDGGHLVSTL